MDWLSKEKKDIVRIRLDLEAVEAKKFLYVKLRKGMKANTELVRALISDAFKDLGGKEEML